MLIAALLCFVIGTWYPLLYSLLPYQDALYHPYSGYHLSETLQILGFTALGFCSFKTEFWPVRPSASTSTGSIAWADRPFSGWPRNPIQWFDTAWGEAYRVVGLGSLMTTARFWAWFDWHGIDGRAGRSPARSVPLADFWPECCSAARFSRPCATPYRLWRSYCLLPLSGCNPRPRTHEMDQLLINQGFPLLSILIFLPLAGALSCCRSKAMRPADMDLMAVTSLVALLSFLLVAGFDTDHRRFSVCRDPYLDPRSISITPSALTASPFCW